MTESAVVELRRYTLRPGQRDVLIELFDREFVESQDALGMQIIGQFRDLDDPDQFVWVRGFPSLASRRGALEAFYGGPVWKQHAEAANATMVDVDNVLLLRPARPGLGFSLNGERAALDAGVPAPSIVVATVCDLDGVDGVAAADVFQRTIQPALSAAGAAVDALLVTEPGPNDFPALPVREGENVLVWFSSFRDLDSYERRAEAVGWPVGAAALQPFSSRPPEVLRLAPTARSLLR